MPRLAQKSLAHLDRTIDRFEQIEDVERLLQRCRRSELDCHTEEVWSTQFLVGERVTGDRDERDRGIELDELANGCDAVHARHEHVDHDGIEGHAADQSNAGRTVRREKHAEPLLLQ